MQVRAGTRLERVESCQLAVVMAQEQDGQFRSLLVYGPHDDRALDVSQSGAKEDDVGSNGVYELYRRPPLTDGPNNLQVVLPSQKRR